jgi:lipopolysaccharide export system permease protein
MNLQQLNHFDDSLTVDLNEILDKFKSTMDKSLIGKSKNILIKSVESVPDSLGTVKEAGAIKIQPVFVDTLFASLNKLERRKAISQAINFARSNKSITTSNVGTAEWKVSRLRRYQNEIHRKYAYSILCLIFFFIGAPLGAIIRKGGLGMPVIVSVLLFLVYYVISMVGEKFSREGMVPPSIGMWISTFILAPVSIWLTQKAVKDSVILNIETYFTWFKKWRLRLKNRLQSP